MNRLYGPHADTILRAALVVAVLAVVGGAWGWWKWKHSDLDTGRGLYVDQPVPFSHAHHVGGLGIDCRYCHQSVETSSFAGLPATQVCMNCHGQLWTQAELLEPVRESWRTGEPLKWNRVHDLADFVYFDHEIHVNKGIGCATCHGRVDEMPLTAKSRPLFMAECLECHRHPEKYVRPRDKVFDMAWQPPADQEEQGERLVKEYGIRKEGLTDCTACHR